MSSASKTTCTFLVDDPSPLASLAPDHVVLIDSLSKRVAPGTSLGWALAPPRLVSALGEAIRAGALVPSGLALALSVRWITDGTVARLVRDKRRDALRRQRLLRTACPDLTIRADPRAYHAWVELPGAWRAESFTAEAAERGIAIAPATAFAVGAGHAPNAVRLAIGSPTTKVLAESLRALNALARSTPGCSRSSRRTEKASRVRRASPVTPRQSHEAPVRGPSPRTRASRRRARTSSGWS